MLEFLNKLKKDDNKYQRTKLKQLNDEVFFLLSFDENNDAFVNVVDSKNKEIEFDYRFYSGATREVLKILKNIEDENLFSISWDDQSNNHLYIKNFEFIVPLLIKSGNCIDHDKNEISFVEGLHNISLLLENETDKLIKSQLYITLDDKKISSFKFLSESYIILDNRIIKINPIGENFKDIFIFNAKFPRINLEQSLSILLSHFANIEIIYNNFDIILQEPKDLLPTIIIEDIDEEKSLYLQILHTIPDFETSFFQEFDINTIAIVDDRSEKIIMRNLHFESILPMLNNIDKILNKLQRKLKLKNGYEIEENSIIVHHQMAGDFITTQLASLLTKFRIIGAEKLKSFKIHVNKPKLNLQLSSGIDFLEGTADLDFDGEIVSIHDALALYKKHSYIPLSDGTNALINHDYIMKLQRIFKSKKDNVKISFFDLPIVEDLLEEKIAGEAFKKSKKIFSGFNKIQTKKYPTPKISGKLRNYQKYGYKWMKYLQENKLGGCLADDMGLGKTIQTISLMNNIYPKEIKSSLIVMPRSLLYNWGKEIEKFASNLTYTIYHGQLRNIEEALQSQLILTTYAIVRNDIEILKDINFHYIVLDESQNIKNINAKTTKAVFLLNGTHRLGLSGTPIENNLRELYSLFRFLNPAMFGSLRDFDTHYTSPIQKDNDKEATLELQKKVYPFILRRLKNDVAKELPKKSEQILYVQMSDEQLKLYETRRKFYYSFVHDQIETGGIKKSQFFILQALSELRQIASSPELKSNNLIKSPKLDLLIDSIVEAATNHHKMLVFSNYIGSLELIAEKLNEVGIDFQMMTGATRNRQELVDNFQNNKKMKVFLMTLKTGGIGLNLTAADYVFIYDPWWNIAAENQAIDRTHRIGQTKRVFSYKLIAKDSIEEKILLLQNKKKELFDNIISSDSASVKFLDEDDIEFLLK